MARPVRRRRVCSEPEYDSFVPRGVKKTENVFLTVDEFEAVRLIDLEKRTHGQCAVQMGVSRTTVTEIYERARSKIADCIINGKALCISGGSYKLCDGSGGKCCGKPCGRTDSNRKEVSIMKIAVAYENGSVFQHFGHTEQFKIYGIDCGKITETQVVDTNGSGHGALVGMLSSIGVDTLVCGGIGAGAQMALAEAGIQLYGGVSGSADEAVNALLAGRLAFDPDVRCDHHGEGHHHGNGDYCGKDKHGCKGNGGRCQ